MNGRTDAASIEVTCADKVAPGRGTHVSDTVERLIHIDQDVFAGLPVLDLQSTGFAGSGDDHSIYLLDFVPALINVFNCEVEMGPQNLSDLLLAYLAFNNSVSVSVPGNHGPVTRLWALCLHLVPPVLI